MAINDNYQLVSLSVWQRLPSELVILLFSTQFWSPDICRLGAHNISKIRNFWIVHVVINLPHVRFKGYAPNKLVYLSENYNKNLVLNGHFAPAQKIKLLNSASSS